MNQLLQTYKLLSAGLSADAFLCLASAVSWLDPLFATPDEDLDLLQDEEGVLLIALHTLRKAFPDLYALAAEAIRRGEGYGEIDYMICKAITERGIPLDNLEGVAFGIPMPAYGVVLEDPDFYANHPDVLPILACFGVSPEPNPYSIDVPDGVYVAGRLLADDLQNHQAEDYRPIAWLMRWLTSSSGNTVVDADIELMAELPPLSWEPDDVAFAIEIIREADNILADALAGLALLNERPDLLSALQDNVRRIYQAMGRQATNHDHLRLRLVWP